MADQQEKKEEPGKEPNFLKTGPETPRAGERAPEISAAERKQAESLDKVEYLKEKIEQKPAGAAPVEAKAGAVPATVDSPAKTKIQRLKKLRQADREKFAEKLDDSVKKEVVKNNFGKADDLHDETVTNIRLK